jgi:hypothetical protein
VPSTYDQRTTIVNESSRSKNDYVLLQVRRIDLQGTGGHNLQTTFGKILVFWNEE